MTSSSPFKDRGGSAIAGHPAAHDGDLDSRIRAAELQVIERDERVQRALRSLGQRAKEAAQPRRLLMPIVGAMSAVVAGIGAFWALKPRRATAQAAAGGTPAQGRPPHAGGAGGIADFALRMLPLAWPLLPPGWRSRISPATASTVLGLAMPLLGKVFVGPPREAPPPTVPYVDLGRYAGRWYEIARLPAPFESVCAGQPQAHYALDGGRVSVANACPLASGEMQVSRGVGRIVPASGNAQLEVSLFPAWLRWLPFAWAPYWIFAVDESARDYRVAIVGSPGRNFLWLLARDPVLAPEELARLVSVAAQLGFNVDRLRIVQAGGQTGRRA